jgi:ribosomal protein S18 acetylase RimI-like enzyme
MGITTSISRLGLYYRRYGAGPTARRTALAVSRALFSNRMILFYCDLNGRSLGLPNLPSSLKVERKRNEAEISPLDLEEIVQFWNSRLAHRSIKERFALGASLWMIKSEGRLAGYGWTLQGGTIEPHYFRLGPNDVHLFDFYVFPQYRGHGINPLLVMYILGDLMVEGVGRAFIEAAEWNHAQLASLRKTPFHRLGRAIKFAILWHTVVCWDESDTIKGEPEFKNTPVPTTGHEGSHVPDLRA